MMAAIRRERDWRDVRVGADGPLKMRKPPPEHPGDKPHFVDVIDLVEIEGVWQVPPA
jgi:hypothetical protein